MSLPKKRVSKSKRNMRRSHEGQRNAMPSLSRCSRCGEAKMPHRVCVHCGHYNDREIIKMEEL